MTGDRREELLNRVTDLSRNMEDVGITVGHLALNRNEVATLADALEAMRPSVQTGDGREGLLPCPFCGGRAITDTEEVADILMFAVLCDACGTRGNLYEDVEEAYRNWNTRALTHRAPDEATVERVARAICDGSGHDPEELAYATIGGEIASVPLWEGFTAQARAAIAAMRVEGEEKL